MTRTTFLLSAAILAVAATSGTTGPAAAFDEGMRMAQAAEPQGDQRRQPGQRPGQPQQGQQGRPQAPNAAQQHQGAPGAVGATPPPGQHAPAAAAPPAQHIPPAAAAPPVQHAPPAAAIPPAQHTPPAAALPQHAPPAAAVTPGQRTPPAAAVQPAAPTPPAAAAPARQVPAVAQPVRPGTPPAPPAAAAVAPNVPAAVQQPARPGVPPAAAVAPAAPVPGAGRPGQQANTPPAQPPAAALAPVPGAGRPGQQQANTPPAPSPAAAAALAPPPPVTRPVDPKAMPQHLEQLRTQRQEVVEGNRTVIRESDRVIIREGGRDMIRHDEAARFAFNAREVNVERRGDITATVALRPDGSRIVTEVDVNGRLLRRIRRDVAGREVIIIDNTVVVGGPAVVVGGPVLAVGAPAVAVGVGVAGLAIGGPGFFVDIAPPVVRIAPELYVRETVRATPDQIFLTLAAPPVEPIGRRYSLDEIRYNEPLRARMPRIDIDTVNFETASWEISPDQAALLGGVAQGIRRAVERNPAEVFLIEGHTDAVGNDVDNLSLSDRRAEAVAVLLTNQFGVPPENLTSQGYGKQFLKIPSPGPERVNRRVAVRRITPLLTAQNQN
jgi:outer membrane protein OmpA-like peptidoglycan-associated protein